MKMVLSVLALIAVASPATAQSTAAVVAPAAALDPARVAASREVIDALMPPSTRKQMIEGMLTPMLANIRQALAQDPKFAAALGSDPRVKTLFDQFMVKQNARTVTQLGNSLPGMTDAMVNAYARRFDVTQLHEIKAFFETPTGRAYMQAAFTIMSDPDVAQWQRSLMTQSMAHVQDDVAALAQQVAALEPKATAP